MQTNYEVTTDVGSLVHIVFLQARREKGVITIEGPEDGQVRRIQLARIRTRKMADGQVRIRCDVA